MHGDPDKLESLHNKREQESYRKVTPEYLKFLLLAVELDPQDLGYEFGRWTGERLATYLAEQTGIQLSGSQVRRILKRKKYSYIWAKYSLEDKQNPKIRAEFTEKLTRYLAITKENTEQLQVWFWDETEFSLRVIRRKSWGKKGKRKKITGQRRRGRVNVMGGIREHDRKRLCFFIKKGNADTFYEQLQQLNEFVKKEWLAKGNQPEKFKEKGPKLVIILDNASYHKRLDIQEKISKELPNIILEFLPAYSPDMNLIELVWHSCKEYIAHRLFESVDELESLLKRLLNEGELIIKWQRKVKNKGNTIIATQMHISLLLAPTRSSAELKQLLGEDFKGILTSDCFSAYNPQTATAKQKCLTHLERDLRALETSRFASNRDFSSKVSELLKLARLAHRDYHSGQLSLEQLHSSRLQLESQLQAVLDTPPPSGWAAPAQRLRQRIQKYWSGRKAPEFWILDFGFWIKPHS